MSPSSRTRTQYGAVLDGAARARRHHARAEEAARARGIRDDRRVRSDDRELVRQDRAVPAANDDRAAQGRRPPVRREPAPGGRVLPRARRAPASALARSSSSAARSCRTTTSPTSKERGASRASSTQPAAVIVKHANPVRRRGRARRSTEAWERALAADPVSAFGCVAVLNRPVGAELGARIAEHFVEVLYAPGYDDEAIAALRTKKALRILVDHERRAETPGERDYKRVLGGLLVQDRDGASRTARRCGSSAAISTSSSGTTCSSPGASASTSRRMRSCSCAACRRSGSAPGQMSRVDAVRIAVEHAREHGHETGRRRRSRATPSSRSRTARRSPSTPASAAIIQPGGSRRDDEVLAAVDAAGAAMVFTDRRHFRH